MARIPGLRWRPIPENSTQPKIWPTQWIIHTFVDSPSVDVERMGDYFERADVTLESHTVLGWDQHDQLLDTEVRADANYRANRRSDGTGAVSTETEDDGTPVELPWNDYQVRELIRTGVELHHLHGIPAEIPQTPDAPGMGYHSLFPGVWTNVAGKTCPGATRIRQFKEVVLPGIRAAISQPASEEDDEVPSIVWYQGPAENPGPHAYQVAGLLGKWLNWDGYNLAKAVGVKEVVPADKALDATWRHTAILVDGPCATVSSGAGSPVNAPSAADVASEFAKRLAA